MPTIMGFEFVRNGKTARVVDEAGNQAVGNVQGPSVERVLAVGEDLKGIQAARLALRVAVAVNYHNYKEIKDA
jgi:hypothetical protein